jgi:hypothetical protein
MFTVRVQAPDILPALLERLSGAEQLRASNRAAQIVAPQLPPLMQARSEATGPAGPFSEGWSALPQSTEGTPGLTVSNSMPVSKYVELPTRPHKILPKNPGGTLAFVWARMGGGLFFFKAVNHPGTAGKMIFQYVMADQGAPLVFEALIQEATEYLIGG